MLGGVIMNKHIFKSKIRDFARSHKRDLPWRTPTLKPDSQGYLDLYLVLVSEVMLQQTQVARVMRKFSEFISVFPQLADLARADLVDVLKVWQGLGYNRRGKFLWESAQILLKLLMEPSAINKKGAVPAPLSDIVTVQQLDDLPGIGPATAASIYCFAFNRPVIFIETNVRKVFIHHFFSDSDSIDDAELVPLIQDTLDYENPREWYYAIMDYGSYLSTVVDNPNTKSKQYSKQSRFTGSDRQIRGKLLREFLSGIPIRPVDEREQEILKQLQKEGLIV